jgi:hypothetical protein
MSPDTGLLHLAAAPSFHGWSGDSHRCSLRGRWLRERFSESYLACSPGRDRGRHCLALVVFRRVSGRPVAARGRDGGACAANRRQLIADLVVIDAEQIARSGPISLGELLQRHAGAELSANGGPGQVSGIFLRGTNTNHVVLLIDGVRVNSATTGTNALEHVPLSQIERIEVLRGPASSLYGADAIGGVIQIFTRTVDGIRAKAGVGSDRCAS